METITTHWLINILIAIPTIFYILMIIKNKQIKEIEEQQEDIYQHAIYSQLIESEQNAFMQ